MTERSDPARDGSEPDGVPGHEDRLDAGDRPGDEPFAEGGPVTAAADSVADSGAGTPETFTGEDIAVEEEDGFEIPVFDAAAPAPAPAPAPASAHASGPEPGSDRDQDRGPDRDRASGDRPADRSGGAVRPSGESGDWTRTDSVRDDPGTLGEEVRKLWEVVHNHFVDPVLRNYPEAAGHLTSAGLEVASAFRALVRTSEQRWAGKPPAERADEAGSDWDGRIVIGEDGGDNDDDTADRPKD